MTKKQRLARIERDNSDLALIRQCKLLGLCRSSLYYKAQGTDKDDLGLMAKIDAQYLKTPFYGYRRMTACLQREGYCVNPKRIRRLMRLMGLQAIYAPPRTSKSHPEHKVYPYLLKDRLITRANQVWATDITYLPMRRGFLYLVVLQDWFSRYVLAWRLSNTLEADFCIEALEEALRFFKPPQIHNSDQGSQFTSQGYVNVLLEAGIEVSMDGRGRFMDNIFVERLWRSVKYEEVYLKAYATPAEAKDGLKDYFRFYNEERPHQALDYRTPQEVYEESLRPDGFMDNSGLPTTPRAPLQQQNSFNKKENGLWLSS
ncbi:MAG: hypothetical protein BGO28_03700 [Alphaproteobacteria bacterium 43-37]|nr:MAG: hypothetical protein BGO28_03700 [Alphaproteobacteria bacterium 43-37]